MNKDYQKQQIINDIKSYDFKYDVNRKYSFSDLMILCFIYDNILRELMNEYKSLGIKR